ncbi:MAG: T9SS type A sorting domain-containing protein [Bacteroidetes bacterium]|nr:T9SS type A sorting domain-containing protein [Bacteroidota bacterium]
MLKSLLILTIVSLIHFCNAQCPREDFVNDYNDNYLGSATTSTDLAWTGNVGSCTIGSISVDSKDKVLQRVNYYRRLVGLPDNIIFDGIKNQKCQSAALMMRANNQLSHTPPTSWTCYTADGAEAASRSNISWSHGSNSITSFISDFGSNNTAVGHRRWILYSRSANFGFGTTAEGMSALWVVGDYTDPPPGFDHSSYPPEGLVPQLLVFGRWSFSKPSADFTNATVKMFDENGDSISLYIEPISFGPGDRTIVWVPSNINKTDTIDVTYTVKIIGVDTGGGNLKNYVYDVTLINPVYPPSCISEYSWVEDSCVCMSDYDIQFLGLKNIFETEPTVYPQPATDILNVTLQAGFTPIVQLFSIEGKELRVEHRQEGTKLIMRTVGLSPGMYIVLMHDKDIMIRRRFIKQ